MKRNVNILLLFLILVSLLANILLLIGFQSEMERKELEVESIRMDFQGNFSNCQMDRDAYHMRLLEVSNNCMVYVFRKQNETETSLREWASGYVLNLTRENQQYRLRLQECSRKVEQLRRETCV